MSKILRPLGVFLVYDKDFNKKKLYYDLFYRLICRDVGNLNALDSNIPLNVFSNDDINSMDAIFKKNEKNIVFVIVDDNLLYNMDPWKPFIKRFCCKKQKNIAVLPIAVSKCAYFDKYFERYNMLSSVDLLSSERYMFESRILDFCIRNLKGIKKIKLFISHTKKDEDGYGEKIAKCFREKIASETKFDFFFDANSIPDGADFGKIIEKNAKNSLLLVLNSDKYSTRDWCQREIYFARKNNCPYVIVSLVKNTSSRIFPYIGNAPCVRYNDNIEYIIWILLKTALNHYYGKEILDYIVKEKNLNNVATLSGVPDLFKLSDIQEEKILHTEPPLMYAESQILKHAYPEKEIITPIKCENYDFKKTKIAFSISNPLDNEKYGGSNLLLNDLIMEIARYILANKGHIIYGGDLRKSGFTESFLNVATSYINEKNKDFVVTNYLPSSVDFSKEEFLRFSQNKVKLIPVKRKKIYSNVSYNVNVLSSMRKERNNNTEILIIAGGKTFGYSGIIPGILEEVLLAMEKNIPIYLLGGFGGMAAKICELRQNKIKEKRFEEIFLGNHLNDLEEFNKNNHDQWNPSSICKKILGYKYFNIGIEQDQEEEFMFSKDVFFIVDSIMKAVDKVLTKYESQKHKRRGIR